MDHYEEIGAEIAGIIITIVGIFASHYFRKESKKWKALIALLCFPGFCLYWMGYGIFHGIPKTVKGFREGLKEGRNDEK